MKLREKTSLVFALAMLSIGAINTVRAEATSFEWSSTSGFLSVDSAGRNAIEAITGQTAFSIDTPAGQRWVVPGNMSGIFTYDAENSEPPVQFAQFTHYVGASLALSAQLESGTGLIGTLSAGLGRVIISEGDGVPGGLQDLVNISLCCGPNFSIGPWLATGASVVWVGEGFQDGTELPLSLPPTGAPLPLGVFSFFNTGSGENISIIAIDLDVQEIATTVEIDVKPGSDANCFNINGHGVIPVAILGGPDLDVNGVDQSSLMFGGLDVRVRGKKGPQCGIEYSNGDAYLDLVCHFEDDASAWEAGDAEAALTGSLYDGNKIEGSDSICLRP